MSGLAGRSGEHRRRLSPAVLGLVSVLLLIGVPPMGPAPAAADLDPSPSVPAAGAQSEADLPIAITVSVLEPRAPAPGGTLRLRGALHNRGGEALTDVRVRLRLSRSRLTSRGTLARTAVQAGSFGSTVPGTDSTVTGLLGAGSSVPFDLTTPVDGLGLTRSGVYSFGVEARARTGSFEELRTAGRIRTFLPFTGRFVGFTPTRLAFLWPVVAPPARGPTGEFLDESLAADMGPLGRLTTLVAAAADLRRRPGVGVTLAVDPALLQAANDMRTGYRVQPAGGGRTIAGEGGAAAARWLTRLRAAVQGAPVVSLPYADPDVVALVRAGLGDDVSHTVQTGREITRTLLPGAGDASTIGWPPGGLLTKPALDGLSGAGVTTVVLSGSALPLTRELTYTPDARATVQTVGGTVRALLTDDVLDGLVAAGAGDLGSGPAAASSARLDEQRFLAETLLITQERPNDQRTVVVTPPRRWNPAAAYARGVLADTGRVPWLTAVTVPQAAAGAAAETPRGQLTYPAEALDRELPAPYLRTSVAFVRTGLREFETVLVGPNAAAVALDLAVFRLESTAWRDDPGRADRLRGAAQQGLLNLKDQVRIGTAGLITLTSRSGTIPVTVVNGLSQQVRVELVLTSNSARVTTSSPGVQTIDAGHSVTIRVQTTRAVRTTGVFPVYAQLYTPEGRKYSPQVKLLVKSTAYGAVALGITGGAFAVLLLAAAVRLVRRGRRARRRPAGTAPA